MTELIDARSEQSMSGTLISQNKPWSKWPYLLLLSLPAAIIGNFGPEVTLAAMIAAVVALVIPLLQRASDVQLFAVLVFLLPFSAKLPLNTLPLTITSVFLYFIVVRGLVTHQRLRFARSMILLLSIVLLLLGVVTSIFGLDPAGSLRKLYNVANVMIILWATTQFVRTTAHIHLIAYTMAISGLLLALLGIAQVVASYLLGPGLTGATIVANWNRVLMIYFEGQAVVERTRDWSIWWRYTNWFANSFNSLRAIGTSWSPMGFAQMLLISFFPMLLVTLTMKKRPRRAALLVLTLVIGLAIILSLSRAAWLALLLGGSYIGLAFLLGRIHLSRVILFRLSAMVIIVGIGAVILAPPATRETTVAALLSIVEPNREVDNQFQSSNDSRFNTYATGLRIIREHWLMGIGPGNYALAANEADGATSHNLYLDVAGEMGIVGLIVYLSIFLIALRNLSYVAKRSLAPFIRALALGWSTSLITLLFYWMFTSYFFEPKINMMVWLVLGMSIVLKSVVRSTTVTQGTPT